MTEIFAQPRARFSVGNRYFGRTDTIQTAICPV